MGAATITTAPHPIAGGEATTVEAINVNLDARANEWRRPSYRLERLTAVDLPFFHGDLESGLLEGRTDEASTVHGRSDHRGAEGDEAGAKTGDLARKHGVSEATLYNWKAKYGGMDVCEAKRLKQLEDENAKLKKLLAEQMLDAAALRELLSKKW